MSEKEETPSGWCVRYVPVAACPFYNCPECRYKAAGAEVQKVKCEVPEFMTHPAIGEDQRRLLHQMRREGYRLVEMERDTGQQDSGNEERKREHIRGPAVQGLADCSTDTMFSRFLSSIWSRSVDDDAGWIALGLARPCLASLRKNLRHNLCGRGGEKQSQDPSHQARIEDSATKLIDGHQEDWPTHAAGHEPRSQTLTAGRGFGLAAKCMTVSCGKRIHVATILRVRIRRTPSDLRVASEYSAPLPNRVINMQKRSKNSNLTDETWIPATGCTSTSAGWKHCYAKPATMSGNDFHVLATLRSGIGPKLASLRAVPHYRWPPVISVTRSTVTRVKQVFKKTLQCILLERPYEGKKHTQ